MQLRPHRVSDRSLEFFHHMAYLLPHSDVRAFFGKPQSDSQKKYNRNKHLIRRFGITLEDYDRMNADQGGLCAICGTKEEKKSLAVDHDHTSGKVRQLLCTNCNPAIGFLREDPELARKVAAYLEKHKE